MFAHILQSHRVPAYFLEMLNVYDIYISPCLNFLTYFMMNNTSPLIIGCPINDIHDNLVLFQRDIIADLF